MPLKLSDLISAPSRGTTADAMAYAKRQGAKRQAFLADYFSELWRLPTLASVKRSMLTLSHNLEIVWVVVAAIAVDVMHDLVSFQQSPQLSLSHQPMLRNVPSSGNCVRVIGHVDVDVPIPFVYYTSLRRSTCPALRGAPALRRAKSLRLTMASECSTTYLALAIGIHDVSKWLSFSGATRRTKLAPVCYATHYLERPSALRANQLNGLARGRTASGILASTRAVFRLRCMGSLDAVTLTANRARLFDGSRLTRHFADLLNRSVRCRAGSAPTLPGFSLPQFYQIGGA